MRTVSKDDPRVAQLAGGSSGDLAGPLAKLLGAVDEIHALTGKVDDMAKHLHNIEVRTVKLEKMAEAAKQYQEDHDELHRNMAAATGKDKDEAQAALAHAIQAQNAAVTEQLRTNMAMINQALATLAAALSEFTDKQISVNVAPGDSQVTLAMPEPRQTRYKLKRNQNGLLDEVVEIEG